MYNKNEQGEIDLAENKDLSNYNNQFRYWLVYTDVYSRYIWVELLKKKSSKNTANKFENILKKSKSYPTEKYSVMKEQNFKIFETLLSKKYNFTVFHTHNREINASHVERVIGTLKTIVQRVLTITGQFDYYTYFSIIIKRYNESPHSSLGGLSPYEVYHNSKKQKK